MSRADNEQMRSEDRLRYEFTADYFDFESETAGVAIKNAWMCGLKSQQNLIII